MSNELQNRTLAFAGMWQAATLVEELARTGSCDEKTFTTTLSSLVVTSPDSTIEVYGELSNLKPGFETLIDQMENQSSQKNIMITRYVIGLLALEKKLDRKAGAMNMLAERISQVKRQLAHFNLEDEQVQANMAGIYSDLISPLGPRIQVSGDPTQLQKPLIQNKIRALLLAGIRSAVLWRQVGGKKRHIIFFRKKMVEQARVNLARI